jgi:hypothetical protein
MRVIFFSYKVIQLYMTISLFFTVSKMKTILVINDNSLEAEHAAKFALLLAQQICADIILANCQSETRKIIEKAVAGHVQKDTSTEKADHNLRGSLITINKYSFGFKPAIREVDISEFCESSLATLIYKNEIWAVVKGTGNAALSTWQKREINIDQVLKKINCPLLLIPYTWAKKKIERITYIADLRYCRLEIVKFIAELARSWGADMSIAHICASGLPIMDTDYAQNVFNEEICANINYERVFFNHIREPNLATVIDIIVNVMHNDMLVLVNRHCHFDQIVGEQPSGILPDAITIPLLIFP